MQAQAGIKQLWDKVVDHIKMKIIHPTLWQSIELAVPIAVEDGEFVIGYAPADHHMSGNLLTSVHKNAIEIALRQFSGAQLNLRVIEGTTPQDWASVKAKDEQMRAFQEAARRKREAEVAVTKSWDGLLETVGRRYAAMPFRQFPQARAKYIEEMIVIISETMDELMPGDVPADELAERSLARVIDKVGSLTEVPGAMIAMELRRFREGGRR